MALASIVAATDESLTGRQAVRVAYGLASQSHAHLTLLKVVQVGPVGEMPSGRLLSTDDRSSSETGELRRFTTWLGTSSNGDVEPEVAVAFGIPGIEIGRLAGLRQADLVVLGRRQRTPDHRLHLGETADALVRRCGIPILFVPPGLAGVRRMVIALDGSERSSRILDTALMFARLIGAERVEAVTVEAPTDDAGLVPLTGRSLKLAAILAKQATTAGMTQRIPLRTRTGNIVEEILAQVVDSEADLLVIGYRRGGQPKLVRPTEIARSLLYAAPSAVLTVPL